MVRQLRRLWGRVEIRVLALLVFGFLLAGLALAVAQLAKSSSNDDLQLVSSWDDLIEKYLDFRERNYALVVPGWFMSCGQTEAILKAYGFEELQKDPDWYWHFDGGVFVFNDDSQLAKLVKHDTQLVIYENMATEELIVLSAPEKEGGEYREEIVYRAPEWPKVKKGEDYERYLCCELSQRQIVWRVTLKSKSLAEEEATESKTRGPMFGSGSGGMSMMLLGGPVTELQIANVKRSTTNLLLDVAYPESYSGSVWSVYSYDSPACPAWTNGSGGGGGSPPPPEGTNEPCTNCISCSTDLAKRFNGLDQVWTLAYSNLALTGASNVTWIDTRPMAVDTNGDPCNRFLALGNNAIDADGDGLSDAVETFVHKSNPNLLDSDVDGVGDGEEIQNGTSPTNPNDPPNVNGTILYSAQQTNVIRVLAVTDSNSWSLAHSTTITNPGPYQIANLPGSNYYVKAFRDLDNDGTLGAIEARGEHSGNPVEITAQVTGIDITLTDPDTDGDGFSDYEEIDLMGTSPTNAEDGVEMLEIARAEVSTHWNLIYPNPLVFTNSPGSEADLDDLANALAGLSNMFYEVTSP